MAMALSNQRDDVRHFVHLQELIDFIANLKRAVFHVAIADFQAVGAGAAGADELGSDFVDLRILRGQRFAAQAGIKTVVRVAG